jgi:RimJ/RimL family protein N-acetyltransferase
MNLYQSERLIYRAYDAPKDDDFYHSFHSDPAVYLNTWKGLPQPVTKKTIEILRKLCEESLLFVVICKKPLLNSFFEEPIGTMAIRGTSSDLAHNRCGDLGIELKLDAQGQGYGPEAMRWVLNWCFMTANLHRVQLEAYEWNKNALRAYKTVGFREEGRLREAIWRDGRWWDELILGILRDEWAESGANLQKPS